MIFHNCFFVPCNVWISLFQSAMFLSNKYTQVGIQTLPRKEMIISGSFTQFPAEGDKGAAK